MSKLIPVPLSADEIECMCTHLSSELDCVMPGVRDDKDDASILAAWREHSPYHVERDDMPREFYDSEADLLEKLLAHLPKPQGDETVKVTLRSAGVADENVELNARVWKAANRHAAELGETMDQYLEGAMRAFTAKRRAKPQAPAAARRMRA